MNVVVYPNCKVNIGLRVIEKREDGYHNLETLFIPAPLQDILEIVTSPKTSIYHYGMGYSLPNSDPNEDLCIKAYKELSKDFDLPPVEIHLYKQIPVGAGLGGGSSDAAFTLKGLNSLFGLSLSDEQLAAYAATLGSDCPFFIYNKPMFGEGRGEILSPYSAPWVDSLLGNNRNYRLEVKTFPIHISTSMAYSGVTPSKEGMGLLRHISRPIEEWRECVVNDFEKGVFEKYPILKKEKEALYEQGALFAQMSGSGSSIFGIFPL